MPSNGLLLRTDIHRLFDLGYVTVEPEGCFLVIDRLKADFDNGKHYYGFHQYPVAAKQVCRGRSLPSRGTTITDF